jgi:hypothetical protein
MTISYLELSFKRNKIHFKRIELFFYWKKT